MANFLSGYDTTAEYNAVKATLDRPHVALTKDDEDVHYLHEPYNNHDYVEIGGLKWSTMNIGANAPTGHGLYFAWGEVHGYPNANSGKSFSWDNYKFTLNGGSTFTKYNGIDSKTVLDIEDDAARINWGGEWRMPTTEELQALGNAVTTTWVTDYQSTGVSGRLCTAKDGSGATIFFPMSGYCNNGVIEVPNFLAFIWTSSLYTSDKSKSYILSTLLGVTTWDDKNSRYFGFPVRPVIG